MSFFPIAIIVSDQFVFNLWHQPDRIGFDHSGQAEHPSHSCMQLIDKIKSFRLFFYIVELNHDLFQLYLLQVRSRKLSFFC